jgi:hypothetical protein
VAGAHTKNIDNLTTFFQSNQKSNCEVKNHSFVGVFVEIWKFQRMLLFYNVARVYRMDRILMKFTVTTVQR